METAASKRDARAVGILESYENGNLSWVKEQAKAMSKYDRKMLYKMSWRFGDRSAAAWFFFDLI